jgi:crotonobetainyl-CoA:carnitine CoA-transferase CaiB-like acyl-CoA transferase
MLHRRPLVLDLSSLWAGPLCAHLLHLCGARVVKLESRERPDGARRGPQRFFDLLNGGKQSVALSFGDVRDLARLRSLIERADIVVESSRPRALEALGISAGDEITRRSGLSWVGITGHGRQAPERDWVAFGDDAGVAAGLAAGAGRLATVDPADSPPLFCGDAIADPLAGLHAAVAALASWQQGGSRILDVSLRDAARFAGAFPGPVERARVERRGEGWLCRVGALAEEVALPRAREVSSAAPELGHDNERVFDELGIV